MSHGWSGVHSSLGLTRAVLGLPLQTLSVGEGHDVGAGVHAALAAAAPHALHALAGAVAAGGVERTRLLAGRPHALARVPWGQRQASVSEGIRRYD